MIKKIAILLFSFFVLVAGAQELPLLQSKNSKAKNLKQETFKDQTKRAEHYFSGIEKTKKGSGYKPFKRWEYRWSKYLTANGTIAPVEHLWKAWEQKNTLAKNAKITSNWLSIGPFEQSKNNGQGRVNVVAVDPSNQNIIYIGAPAGGLWKSSDGGINWIPLTDYLPQIGVSGIAIDKNNTNIIYISTGDDDAGDSYSVGVLKSVDGGQTWNNTGALAGNPISSNEIVIDPTNSNRIWVATGTGLFLSTNAGSTWQQKLTGHIKDFKLKPNNPNTIYAVSNNRFFRSTNGGNSFQTISTGLPSVSDIGTLRVEVSPANSNKVYVVAGKTLSQKWAFHGVYVSTNSGTSFTKTQENSDIFESDQAWFDLAFTVSPTDENTIFVGVLNIWKSTDGGNNFTKINDWQIINSKYTHADIHFLRFFNGNLFAGTDGGVYKSSNLGDSFSDLTKNASISQFYKLSTAKYDSNKMAGGLQDNGGFALNNSVWSNYHSGDGMDTAFDPTDENTFYGFTQFGKTLTKTSNGGVSNKFITEGPIDGNWVTPLIATKGGDLYAGYNQLYTLKDKVWKKVSNHTFGGNIESLEIDPSNNNNIYASRALNLFISNDKGASFSTRTASQTGLTGINISSIEVHNSNSNIIWITTTGVDNTFGPSSGHTGGGVFKSINGGQTFINITAGLPNESKFVVKHHPFTTNNSIYVGTALGVYHRNDDTNTWEVFSTNLPNVAVSDIEINPYDNIITAATYGRGVWQSAIPAITLPLNDVDVTKIASPVDIGCGTINPKITVTNNGQNTITSLTINYAIDNGSNQTFNWTGGLSSNKSTEITLPSISLPEGNHTFSTESILVNDENNFNNTSNSTFFVNKKGEGQYINTFGDVNPDVWLTSTNLWEIGQPTTPQFNGIVASGYVTNLDGNYSDKTVSYLISNCYDLTSLEDPVLKFKMAFDIENRWDVLYMEYSTNNGQSWDILGTASDPNWYNSSYKNVNRPLTVGKQWTGKDTTLKEYSYDLTALESEPTVMFRFVFASDTGVNGEGVVIDDFQIDASKVLAVNDELNASKFAIHPNPSKDIFTITRTDYLSSDMRIQVFDITGKLIAEQKNITTNDYELDLSHAIKGLYFVRIYLDNKVLSKKIILQ